jgi:hypothetical protein
LFKYFVREILSVTEDKGTILFAAMDTAAFLKDAD